MADPVDVDDLMGQLGGIHFERVHNLMPQLGGKIAVEFSRKIAAKKRAAEGERLAGITRLVALKFR